MGARTGFLIIVKRVQFVTALFVCLSCTSAKAQMPSDFSDLKSVGLKGPVKKVTSTYYNEKQVINNKPIHTEDFITKDVFSYNENGGMGISGTTEGGNKTEKKTYYIKSVPLSSTQFPLTIEILTMFSNEGSPYEEMDKLKQTVKRKWVNPGLWVRNYYAQGKLQEGSDSLWIDSLGLVKQTKSIFLVANMKITKIVELRTNEKHEVYQQVIRTADSTDPVLKTTITDVTGLQVDQYGNPTCIIYRNTTTGKVRVSVQEIEYYTD
jgi:hypothetical protein